MTRAFLGYLVTVAATGVVLATSHVAPQQATFSAGVEAVRVDALVLDGVRVVRGLGAADFQVRDNGVPQAVDLVSFEQVPLLVVLVLDASESVVGTRLDQLRAAGLAALDGLSDSDRAALLTFNQSVALVSARTGDVPSLRKALHWTRPGGGTALYDAIHSGIVVGSADDARTLVLVFTDGTDTSSFLAKEAVLDTARRGDAVVYSAIEGRRTPFLQELATATGGAVSTVNSTKDLPGLFTRILDEFRQRYLIGYTPKGVAKVGWHRVEIGIRGQRYTVRARSGYQVGR